VAARTNGDVKKVMEAGGWSSTATALRYVDLWLLGCFCNACYSSMQRTRRPEH
jgi:hypothetical protein